MGFYRSFLRMSRFQLSIRVGVLFLRMKSRETGDTIWEFPKIGDPSIVPQNSRILIIRTPQ